jgi:hypothetical protein
MFIYTNSYSITKFTFNYNLWHYVKEVLNFVVDELMYASESSTSRLIYWLSISGLIALCLYSHVICDNEIEICTIYFLEKNFKKIVIFRTHPKWICTCPKTGSFSKNPSTLNVFLLMNMSLDMLEPLWKITSGQGNARQRQRQPPSSLCPLGSLFCPRPPPQPHVSCVPFPSTTVALVFHKPILIAHPHLLVWVIIEWWVLTLVATCDSHWLNQF